MKAFKLGLTPVLLSAILFFHSTQSSFVIVVNNSEKEVILKRTESGKDKFRQEIKVGNLWLFDNINFDNDSGNVLISRPLKKMFGGNDYEKFRLKIRKNFEIKNGDKFGDYIILLNKSKDGELSSQIKLITPELIKLLKKDFLPIVFELNEIADSGLSSLDEKGVKNALDIVEEFYEIYRNHVGKHNIIKEIYSEFMVKISAFKEDCGSNRLNPLMVSRLCFDGVKIEKENKLNCLKIIEEIIDYGKEDIELELVRKFWQTNKSLLQEIKVFAESIITNSKYKNNKNIINKVIMVCSYFKGISDQEREAAKNDLFKIISKKFPALISNFEDIINLSDKEIGALDKSILKDWLQKFEEFDQRYNGIAGQYSIIGDFYREELDKVVVLARKFKDVFDKIDSVKYKTVQMPAEDIRLYSGVVERLCSLNKENFEVDLIKFFVEQKFEFLNKLGKFMKFLSEDNNCPYDKSLLEKIDSTRLLFIALDKKEDRFLAKHELIEIIQSILNPAIIKLNKIINLKRKDIALLSEQDLEKWDKKISKFKESYKNNLNKYSIVESFYKDSFDKLLIVGSYFKTVLDVISSKKNESELRSYKELDMLDSDKRECKKIINKICAVKENFELELVRFLGTQKIDWFKKIQDFSRFVYLKETKNNNKNIINKIVLMSDFFALIKDKDRDRVAQELLEKIEVVFVSNYLKLKKIIALKPEELALLEEQALRSDKKKITEFSHEFGLTVKKYEILGLLFKDLKDKVDSVEVEIQKALCNIELAAFEDVQLSKEAKLKYFVDLKKIINKGDFQNLNFESSDLKNIKTLAQKMLTLRAYAGYKDVLSKIIFSIGEGIESNVKPKVELKKTKDGFVTTESMFVKGYGCLEL